MDRLEDRSVLHRQNTKHQANTRQTGSFSEGQTAQNRMIEVDHRPSTASQQTTESSVTFEDHSHRGHCGTHVLEDEDSDDEETRPQTVEGGYVSLCKNIILFTFCAKKGMSCSLVFLVTLLWVVAVSLTVSLVVRYAIFSPSLYHFAPSDIRVLQSRISTIFCREAVVTASRYLPVLDETRNEKDVEFFTANLMPSYPHLLLVRQKKYVFNSEHVIFNVTRNELRTESFYLLLGSKVFLNYTVIEGNVNMYFIRGDERFRQLTQCHEEPRERCSLIEPTQKAFVGQTKSFHSRILYEGHYYIVYKPMSGYGDKTPLCHFTSHVFLERTLYDLSGALSTCAATTAPGACNFGLAFGRSQAVVVSVPGEVTSAVLVTTTCTSRTSVYLLLFVIMPICVFSAFAVTMTSIVKMWFGSPSSSETIRATSGLFPGDEQLPLHTPDRFLVAETTPLLWNSNLPTYEQATTCPHPEPPPDYQTDAD